MKPQKVFNTVNKTHLKRGTQIVYIPDHADGLSHPDVEFGFVTSCFAGEGRYFCRYWSKLDIRELRTKANSELTFGQNIVLFNSVDQEQVVKALEEYC